MSDPLPPAEIRVVPSLGSDEQPVVILQMAFGGTGPVKRPDGLWQAAIVLPPDDMLTLALEMIEQSRRARAIR